MLGRAVAPPVAHSMLPEVAGSSPAMSRSAVDLPQPEGPRSDRKSPARTRRSSRASAVMPFGNSFETPVSVTSGAPAPTAIPESREAASRAGSADRVRGRADALMVQKSQDGRARASRGDRTRGKRAPRRCARLKPWFLPRPWRLTSRSSFGSGHFGLRSKPTPLFTNCSV